MPGIRPYRPGDESELASVCLQTADSGSDATGLLDDDALWANLFVLPYVARHPELAFVAEADDGRAAGYVVAAADTDRFETWFRDGWWPRFRGRWPPPAQVASRQYELLEYAYGRGSEPVAQAAAYPAHLHIDLLPELQGQGLGRQLIVALVDALRAAGVGGVHAVPLAGNAGAVAFYRRLGFSEVVREPNLIVFGMAI